MSELKLKSLVENFHEASQSEAPSLAEKIGELDDEGRRNLGGILGRFDSRGKGELDAKGRLLASRILDRLRTVSTPALVTTNKVLDYLDLNANSILEENEMELCVEVLEMFSRAESDNSTLSERELEMLYAVLRHIDDNDNKALDSHERQELRSALEDPAAFLAEQKQSNPLLKELL